MWVAEVHFAEECRTMGIWLYTQRDAVLLGALRREDTNRCTWVSE